MIKEPITLKDWIKTKTGKVYIRVSALIASFYTVFQGLKFFGINEINVQTLHISPETLQAINLAIHLTFIAFVVFGTAYRFAHIKNADYANQNEKIIWQNLELLAPSEPHLSEDEDEEKKQNTWIEYKLKVNKVAKQFTWFWFLGWLSWFIHYLYLLVVPIFVQWGWSSENKALGNLLNNLNSLMFIFLFMTLTITTSKYGALFWSKLICLVLALYSIEWLMYKLSHNSQLVTLSFALVAGLFAGTALAAFIGSINSKFINIPVRLFVILYFYAAIQPLYVFFGLEKEKINSSVFTDQSILTFIQQIIIFMPIFAFILKVVLFIVVTWILQTGRLIYFQVQEGSLNNSRDKHFAKFLEVVDIDETQLT